MKLKSQNILILMVNLNCDGYPVCRLPVVVPRASFTPDHEVVSDFMQHDEVDNYQDY